MTDTTIDTIAPDMHEIVVVVRGDVSNIKDFVLGLNMACITEAKSSGVEVLMVQNVTTMRMDENE